MMEQTPLETKIEKDHIQTYCPKRTTPVHSVGISYFQFLINTNPRGIPPTNTRDCIPQCDIGPCLLTQEMRDQALANLSGEDLRRYQNLGIL